ncbi:MAG: hypothetical protein FWD99_02450 [Oscillospiraceae bacterium]|nr:hypothetical protein [Oscillospiraceae bacterium]
MEPIEKHTASERATRLIWRIHRLVFVNLICFLATLPVMAWFYLLLNTYINAGLSDGFFEILPGPGLFSALLLQLPPVIFYLLLAVSAVLTGPLLLGLHYISGSMVTERHIWFSDFPEQALRNARQGIVLGLFSLIALHMLLWNVFGGLHSDIPWIHMILIVSRWGSGLLILLLFLVFPYVCQIIVSIEQPLWTALKNALILARVYLGRGLLALTTIAIYWWVTSAVFPMVSLLTLPLLSIGLTAFIQATVCRPVVEKYILAPARERESLQDK